MQLLDKFYRVANSQNTSVLYILLISHESGMNIRGKILLIEKLAKLDANLKINNIESFLNRFCTKVTDKKIINKLEN